MSSKQELSALLKKHKVSVTSARLAVFEALSRLGPCTFAELNHELSPSVNRASIYRTIKLFESLGVVHRLPMGWKYKLELSDLFNKHHHHISCAGCGQISVAKEDRQIERLILDITSGAGYEHLSHSLEITGLCAGCQSKGYRTA
jgi:Fur family transcriptional regulator, ferric uptake regulator